MLLLLNSIKCNTSSITLQNNIAPMNPFCCSGKTKRNPWWCYWNEAEMFFGWDCAHYGATP